MHCPVIDIEKTSNLLKQIRIEKEIKISTLQKLFAMENPQSIYDWENPNKKSLPRLDNLVILAKFYDVKMDDIIILKEEVSDFNVVSEDTATFGVSDELILYVLANSSDKVLKAIEKFYGFSFKVIT